MNMKFFRHCALTAGLLCAAGSASAQYYPYAAPAALPLPANPQRLAYQDGVPPPPVGYPQTELLAPIPAGQPLPAGAFDAALADPWASDCVGCQPCAPARCWYVSLATLYMERNKPDAYQMSFDTANPLGELILNRDSLDDWQEGLEVRVGRRLGCNSAVEFTYWTLDNFEGEARATDPAGNINTPFDFRSLSFGIDPVTEWFDNAQAHRHSRRNELHNLELNWIYAPTACQPCSRLRLEWLTGLRYFRFDEDFLFASSDDSVNFGDIPASEAYYNIEVTNNLLGLQAGGRADLFLSRRLSLYAAPRFGAYVNFIDHESSIRTGDGIYALRIESEKEIISFLGQIDVGVNYQLSDRFRAFTGYRAVAVSGIGLADRQIPFLQDDLFGISDIDTNADLVLHGAVSGLEFRF